MKIFDKTLVHSEYIQRRKALGTNPTIEQILEVESLLDGWCYYRPQGESTGSLVMGHNTRRQLPEPFIFYSELVKCEKFYPIYYTPDRYSKNHLINEYGDVITISGWGSPEKPYLLAKSHKRGKAKPDGYLKVNLDGVKANPDAKANRTCLDIQRYMALTFFEFPNDDQVHDADHVDTTFVKDIATKHRKECYVLNNHISNIRWLPRPINKSRPKRILLSTDFTTGGTTELHAVDIARLIHDDKTLLATSDDVSLLKHYLGKYRQPFIGAQWYALEKVGEDGYKRLVNYIYPQK